MAKWSAVVFLVMVTVACSFPHDSVVEMMDVSPILIDQVDAISISLKNGDIDISRGPDFSVEMKKTSTGGDALEDIRLEYSVYNGLLTLQENDRDGFSVFGLGGETLNLVITIPAGIEIENMVTGDGSVSLSGGISCDDITIKFSGDILLDAPAGSSGLFSGTIDASNGDVEVNGPYNVGPIICDNGEVSLIGVNSIDDITGDEAMISVEVRDTTGVPYIKTELGNITVKIDPSLSCQVNASTGDGVVYQDDYFDGDHCIDVYTADGIIYVESL